MNSTELQALASAQGITLDPLLLVDYPIGTWFWAIHHEVVAEQLTEPLANRIECILTQKNASERKVRLAALRPVKNQESVASAQKAYKEAIAPAWNVYDEAITPVEKAYYEAIEAVAAARKARDEAITPQWTAEYPDHPAWGGNGLVF